MVKKTRRSRDTRAITLLVGAGRMGGALLKGWVANGVGRIVVVEPLPSASLKRFARSNGVDLFPTLGRLGDAEIAACVIALKPQILKTEAVQLAFVARSGALMLSIAAGTRIASLRQAWGTNSDIVRAMPNTPG